jgi:hypothetical protein
MAPSPVLKSFSSRFISSKKNVHVSAAAPWGREACYSFETAAVFNSVSLVVLQVFLFGEESQVSCICAEGAEQQQPEAGLGWFCESKGRGLSLRGAFRQGLDLFRNEEWGAPWSPPEWAPMQLRGPDMKGGTNAI